MTKFNRCVAVCFTLACIALSSCAEQNVAGTDKQNLSSLGAILQNKNAVLKPLEPDTTAIYKRREPFPRSVIEGADKLAAGIKPPIRNSGQKTVPQPAVHTRQLVGLHGDALNHLLGRPTMLRREAEVEVWQYRTAGCVLHLFLYRDEENGAHRVLHVEAVHTVRSSAALGNAGMASSAQKVLLQSCLSELIH